MAKEKTSKKVIARFNGKGFKLGDGLRIHHKSSITYLDKEAYLIDQEQDFCKEFLSGLNLGHLLNNPRVKPGSISITFHILEK